MKDSVAVAVLDGEEYLICVTLKKTIFSSQYVHHLVVSTCIKKQRIHSGKS